MVTNTESTTDSPARTDNHGLEIPSEDAPPTDHVTYLLKKARTRLTGEHIGIRATTPPRNKHAYNRGLRDAALWWRTATESERDAKRDHVTTWENRLQKLFLKPPQIRFYNNFVLKKLLYYQGWSELFRTTGNPDKPDELNG